MWLIGLEGRGDSTPLSTLLLVESSKFDFYDRVDVMDKSIVAIVDRLRSTL
ncbi:hypothetical protein [Chamaesiphon polymorphus]|uniref:hypothetical protein n=1 Tax=Chamaesiphon polymorphus TaxID=2107691 RepID=UPI0015E69C85|nr:hypothetical protein [Chamaesiphon polymorphus]